MADHGEHEQHRAGDQKHCRLGQPDAPARDRQAEEHVDRAPLDLGGRHARAEHHRIRPHQREHRRVHPRDCHDCLGHHHVADIGTQQRLKDGPDERDLQHLRADVLNQPGQDPGEDRFHDRERRGDDQQQDRRFAGRLEQQAGVHSAAPCR